MKRASGMFALLGLVGCFLPIFGSFSLFDARHFDALGVYLVVAAFAIPMVLGVADKLATAGNVLALGCFSYVLLHRFGFDVLELIRHGSFGGRAMGIGAVGGFVTALASLTETKARQG